MNYVYMMGHGDVAVVGEGGILEDGTIQPNVSGYIIIDQVYNYVHSIR